MAKPSEEKPMEVDSEKSQPTKKKEAEEKQEDDLSEEDRQLKENLELMVQRAQEGDAGVQKLAVESIANEIRSATSSMTSVPKPLKFLRPHYLALTLTHAAMPAGAPNAAALADVLSVLAMTSAAEGARDALKYRLEAGGGDVAAWGHEYMRHLSGEIADEHAERRAAEQGAEDLMALADQIVPWCMAHNAEPEAVDLLLELDSIGRVVAHVDAANAPRTCRYLLACAGYLPEPDDAAALRAAFDSYAKAGSAPDALRVALRMHDSELVASAFALAKDNAGLRRQLAHVLAAAGEGVDLESGPTAVADEAEREALREIISNTHLSERFLALARDLDVVEARTPEDVYKMHLVEGRAGGPAVDSARANLASTFVNAFVNAGFGQDKLVTAQVEDEKVHWVFKNKDHGKMAAAASLGAVLLWDVEGGLPQIDRFLYSPDPHVVAGALLAVGMVTTNVADEVDPAYAILSEYVGKEEPGTRCGALLGLGLAYAGKRRQEVADLLLPVASDPETSMEVAGVAALSLGLVLVGSADGEAVEALLQALMLRGEADLATPGARQICLALGLLLLGRGEAAEATVEVARTLPPQVARFLQHALEACAYAGTGDVLRVQALLAACGEHPDSDASDGAAAGDGASASAAAAAEAGGAGAGSSGSGGDMDKAWRSLHQSVAVLGLGLVAGGEELGVQMAQRSLEHLLQYGEAPVRRGVPLALALLYVSNPDMSVMDTLSRLSHDTDPAVASNAVLGLGLIGAGTNNARLAGLLRNLSAYYYKEPTLLFLVRIAQGLVHLGKGLLTISPYHSDRLLLSGASLAGILAVLFSCMDMKSTLAGKQAYLLYTLVAAIRPRMLMTVDESGKALAVPVRVGAAVDVVAQAGRPKAITGFQTHTTPVLLAAGERAELGTEKFLPLSSTLEGVVVLKENPDYVETHE